MQYVVRCLSLLPWGASIGDGAVKYDLVCFSMREVLLFCSYRVHNRGGDAVGQYDIFVKMVLLILFEGSTSIPFYVGFSFP